MSKLKRLLCYESQHQSQSNEKSLVQFDYEKAVSNYLGTQSTFKSLPGVSSKSPFGLILDSTDLFSLVVVEDGTMRKY